MKKILSHILNIISYLYSRLIHYNLTLLNFSNINFYYNHSLGFGDSICYYLHYYQEIKSSRQNVPLTFGGFHEEIVKFFFSKYRIIFFKIYSFMPYYRICKYLIKSSSYKPIINYKIDYQDGLPKDELLLVKNYDLIFKKILKTKRISSQIMKLTKKKYICFFVKNYNNNINDISSNPVSRQTTDFSKIDKIFLYLISKNLNIFILGDYKDKGTAILKKKYYNKKNVYFTADLSINVTEQIYINSRSQGFIGNQAGLIIPFILLKKKTLVFDSIFTPSIKNNPKLKHLTYMYKKIKINEKKFRFGGKYSFYKKKFNIIENDFNEIKEQINKIFL
jgi:hypothetical protein